MERNQNSIFGDVQVILLEESSTHFKIKVTCQVKDQNAAFWPFELSGWIDTLQRGKSSNSPKVLAYV